MFSGAGDGALVTTGGRLADDWPLGRVGGGVGAESAQPDCGRAIASDTSSRVGRDMLLSFAVEWRWNQ